MRACPAAFVYLMMWGQLRARRGPPHRPANMCESSQTALTARRAGARWSGSGLYGHQSGSCEVGASRLIFAGAPQISGANMRPSAVPVGRLRRRVFLPAPPSSVTATE